MTLECFIDITGNCCYHLSVSHVFLEFDLFSFVTAVDKGSRGRKLKHDVIEAVNELIQDISTCYEQIAEQAVEHIHQKFVSRETSLRYIVTLLLFYSACCLKTCYTCSSKAQIDL